MSSSDPVRLPTHVPEPAGESPDGWWTAPRLGPRIAFALAALELLAVLAFLYRLWRG